MLILLFWNPLVFKQQDLTSFVGKDYGSYWSVGFCITRVFFVSLICLSTFVVYFQLELGL